MRTLALLCSSALVGFACCASAQTTCCCPQRATDVPAPRAVAALISFYRVPLRCPAAPSIGCGSHAKPILLGLEQRGAVSEAWLNRPGTIMAVVWKPGSSNASRLAAIRSIANGRASGVQALTGPARASAAKGFQAGTGWYRGAQVDRLSAEEAATISARMVRRVEAKMSLEAGQAQRIRTALSFVVRRCLTGRKPVDLDAAKTDFVQQLARDGGGSPSPKLIAALQNAFAQGSCPLPGEQ